jgi:hypothetical protein
MLFTQLELLGPNDLKVQITDEQGVPFDPYMIVYAFYRHTPTRGVYRVGAENRVPIRHEAGYYYVGERLSTEFLIGDYYVEWIMMRTPLTPKEIIGRREFGVQGYLS